MRQFFAFELEKMSKDIQSKIIKEVETLTKDKLWKENEWIAGDIVKVIVDRPLGSQHPQYKETYYPINYGFVEGIMAEDEEEQDAYILGVDVPVKEFVGEIIAIIHRDDDIEEKWVVVPLNKSYTKEEIKKQVEFQEKYLKSGIIM